MRNSELGRLTALAGAAVLTLALAACGSTKDEAPTSEPTAATDGGAMKHEDGAMSKDDGASRTGTFAGRNGKKVAGTVTVADGKVTVNVPSANGQRSGEVWLCPYVSKAEVTIGRGENSGRTFTYYNVVRRWVKLGDWKGGAESFTVPVADVTKGDANVDHAAVLVQSGAAAKPGAMLGVATANLK